MRDISRENVLEALLANEDCREGEDINGVVIGKLVELTGQGEPLVNFASNPTAAPLAAKSTIVLEQVDLDREVILLFEGANTRKPIIIGLVQPSKLTEGKAKESSLRESFLASVVECDGERVVFSAGKEIVLRCGDASITLTRAGKILLRGKYLLSRSSGVNRIKGGSVQVN